MHHIAVQRNAPPAIGRIDDLCHIDLRRQIRQGVVIDVGPQRLIGRRQHRPVAVPGPVFHEELADQLPVHRLDRLTQILGAFGKIIAAQMKVVRGTLDAETPAPVFVDLEPAAAEHMPAPLFLAEAFAIAVDFRFARQAGLEFGKARPEALAVFGVEQRVHIGHHARRDDDVLRWRQRPVIGLLIDETEPRGDADLGEEKARAPLRRRVGMRKDRGVEHRHAENFQPRIAVIDHLLFGILVHLAGPQAPGRIAFAVLAQFARRIIGIAQRHRGILVADRRGGRNAAITFQPGCKAQRNTRGQGRIELDLVGILRVGALADDHNMTAGDHAIAFGVVFQLVRHQRAVLLAYAYIAARDIAALGEIVDPVGFQVDGRVRRFRRLRQRLGRSRHRQRRRAQQNCREAANL